MTAVAPPNGTTNVGDNAAIHFTFNKIVDTNMINPSTVTPMSGANSLPYSLSFSTTNNVTNVTLTPQAPLPDGVSITLALGSGITDNVGQAIAAQNVTFQTANGPNFTAPQLLYQSPASGETTNVPVNATFTWIFNEPLDPTAINNGNTFLYQSSTGTYSYPVPSLSTDGRTVTIVPSANLASSSNYEICVYVYDLERDVTDSCISFTTGAQTDTVAPQVISTNPLNSATGAATNSAIDITFSEPVRGTTLGQITLATGGNFVAATPSLVYSGNTVRLTPASILQRNTTYSVAVTGVQDIAGNTMVGTYGYSFTTGENVITSGTQLVSASVLVGGIPTQLIAFNSTANLNVQVTTPITLVFSNPVDPASFGATYGAVLYNETTSTTVPVTLSLSANGTTATLTPQSSLSGATQYLLYVAYDYGYIVDQAGNNVTNGQYFYFKTP